MPAPRSRRRARLASLVSVALAVTGFQFFLAPAPSAQAASSTIVINEVYMNGGSSGATYTHRYVELRNLTGADIPLTGYSLQYRPATNSGNAGNVTALTGSIPANGYYVVTGTSNGANGVAVPNANQTSSLPMAAGGGTVILVNGTTAVDPSSAPLVDKLSYGTGNTPEGNASGAGPTGNTVTKSLGRSGASVDTDNNAADFSVKDLTPGTANDAATVTLTNPGTQTSFVGQVVSLQLQATGGSGTKTWGATNLPTGLTINTGTGEISGTPTTVESPTVNVTVTDSSGSDSESFQWTVDPAPVVSTIAQVQGTGATTPVDGDLVTVEGEVTAAYPTGGLNGFYIQTPGADATPDASDGIFVYGGPSGFTTYPAIGASVRVTGTAGEFSGATQITSTDGGVQTIADLPGDVVEKTQIPGADCALPGTNCDGFPALNAAREKLEGEALQPAGDYTATDVYDFGPYIAFDGGAGSSNSSQMFGEIGLAANSDKPLVAPTEIIDAQATVAKNKRIAYNNAHRIVLDDGSSLNYTQAANTGSPFPWLTSTHAVRVGAEVTFPEPVIFTFGFNTWRLVPSSQVVGAPSASQPQIEQTRAAIAAGPENVGGDVKLATFNVLNFFPTTGNEFVTSGLGTCTYFTDRQGNQITNNQCNPNGPRGAANTVNLERQRAKIVAAINTADADIVSLEELENSVKFGKPRDFAINELVAALNADAGPGTWAAVPSPAASGLPPVAEQDVIRNGFIYKPASVALVGGSVVLADQSSAGEAFEDAREPLAQAFKAVGTSDSDAFAVIVNHFKSKGSGTPDPDGQGNANDRRVIQANTLVTFANTFKTLRGITRVFLAGDFNAYSKEDPIQVLNAAGYTNLESTFDPEEESYNFDGQVGSLDHVLANSAALADVDEVDIWPINSYESVYYEYSRFNYNVTNLYNADPFRSSDHNPELVGINTATPGGTTEIQILGTNDFHGRIADDPTSAAAGAAVMAGAVKQLRAEKPNTVFAAAGDLIGASTFESFILNDKPTIDALNEAGLEVSAAGNHEFDQGYDDLVNRVMAPYDPTTNPEGGAEWEYIAANVRKDVDDSHALAPTWTQEFGDIKVGFVGAVTEHLPELVSPGGIEEIYVTDVVDEVNDAADDLKADGADIVVMLVHEGAPMTSCTDIAALGTDTDFGSIVKGVNANIDAIVSGHTHLEYNCSFPVPAWQAQSRTVTERPVVSAGQYGAALNRIVFTVDSSTGEVLAKTQSVLKMKVANGGPFNYPIDGPTQDIVDDALAESAVLGAVPLGQIAGPMLRGYLANGTTENRGVESTLGNLVAEVQRWQTDAQIAFMNPGGLRKDMLGNGASYPKTVTYKQAAEVQPFANGVVNMDLTGAQIKAALEQQWQPGGASRPFLKLGASEGFTYTSDPDAAQGSRITGMWLDGEPIQPATVYSVTVNSFLSTGGDNFGAFAGGANKAEVGVSDLQAMVNYLDEFANTGEGDPPLPVPTEQNGVHVNFPAGAPASYVPGDHVTFDVSGWSMSNAGDPKDTEVVVKLGTTTLGTAPLDNTIQAALPGFDTTGTASVDVVLPASVPVGQVELTLEGATTGTVMPVVVTVAKASATVNAGNVSVEYGKSVAVPVTVTSDATPAGTVTITNGATVLGTAPVSGGVATVTLPARSLPPGVTTLTATYSGNDAVSSASDTFTVTVAKAASTTVAELKTKKPRVGDKVELEVTVTGANGVLATGTVQVVVNGKTRTATLSNGTAVLKVGKYKKKGKKTVTVEYLGSDLVAASSTTIEFKIRKKRKND